MTAVTNRPDTVLAVDCDVDDTDDLSQVNHALIDNPFSGQESSYLLAPLPSTIVPAGAGAGYEVTVRCDMRDNLTGFIWAYANAGAAFTGCDFGATQSSGTLQLYVNNTTYNVPDFTISSTLFDAIVSFNGRPNPFTTGASDAIVCDVYIYDDTAGSLLAVRQFTHPEISITSGYGFAIGGRVVDAATDYFSATWGPARYVDSIRIGKRAISLGQFLDDYSLRTAPTAAGGTNIDACQGIPETTERLVSPDAVGGPIYQMAGHHVKHAGRRGVSNLVHHRTLDSSWQGSLYNLQTIERGSDKTLENQGTPAVTDGPSGPNEPAVRCDSGGYRDTGTPWSGSIVGDYSVSFWVRCVSLPAGGSRVHVAGFCEDTSGSPSNAYGEITIDSNGAIRVRNQAGTPGSATAYTATSSNSLISANTWHHVAITFTDQTGSADVNFWVDGVEDSTVTGFTDPDNYSGSDFCVGGTYNGTSFSNDAVDIGALKYSTGIYSDQMIEFEARQGQAVLWRESGASWTDLYHWACDQNSAGMTPQKMFMPYTETEGTVHLSLGHSWKRPVSPMASHLKVVIVAQGQHATGGSYTADPKIYAYSQSAAPGKLYWPPQTIETYKGKTGAIAETAATYEIEGIKIARNENGETWITLGVYPGTSTSQIEILQVQVFAYSKETTSSNPLPYAFP